MTQKRMAGETLSAESMLDFERLLPLEGGNNFRDLGGYATEEGKLVRPGYIFRSGVMTSLTDADQQYLNDMGIRTIVDFRSREELDIFPNHWAARSKLNLVKHDYSMQEIYALSFDSRGNKKTVDVLYQIFPTMLVPQLTLLFRSLIEQHAPLVFNCSAGQDRTGIAAALILNTLGVSWDTILEDYHLSTEYRRPEIEHAGVNLEDHADTNTFAKLMLRYSKNGAKPEPLKTENDVPYLYFAFRSIESRYGSITEYLHQEIGIDNSGIDKLKSLYLQ